MNKFKLVGICALILTLALSGCLARTSNLTRSRVDQERSLSTNNHGYIMEQSLVLKEIKSPPQIIKKPVVVNAQEMDRIITVFSESIKKAPNSAGAYYNRGMAYFYKNNYEQCWQDVHMAESLGYKFNDDFIKLLKKVSQREK